MWKMKQDKIATDKRFYSNNHKTYHNLTVIMIASLLSVIVVILGAVLPIITAKVYDNNVIGKINYEEMRTTELETQKLTIIEKLELTEYGRAILIEENRTVKTKKEIEELVKNKLTLYRERGLIYEDIRFCKYKCTPYMYYISEKNNIFWEVFVIIDGSEQRQLLRLLLDDEKGLIFHISYESSRPMMLEEWKVLWYRFYELYFEDWGLQNKSFDIYEEKDGIEKGGMISVVCTEGKDTEAYIHLRIHEGGFYNVMGDIGVNQILKSQVVRESINN